MAGMWAAIKSIRAVSYFKMALNRGGTGDLKDKWHDNKSGYREKVILSGVIAASTIAIATRGLWRWGKKKKENHDRKKHEAEQNRKIAELEKQQAQQSALFQQQQNQQPQQEPQVLNPTTPVEDGVATPLDSTPQDMDDTDPFSIDAPIGARRFDLERDLIVLRVSSESNERFAKIIGNGSEPELYVTGSGIYTEEHEPYYKLSFAEDKTFHLAKLLEHFNEHEYQDILTLFELFDY